MFCPNCGSEVSEKAVVCVKCGVALKPITPVNPTAGQIMPKTWLVESILATIFCCMPFGIVGIVNAANVSSRFGTGDLDGAIRASQQAGKWTKVAFWIGISGVVLYCLFLFAFGGLALLGTLANY